MASKPNTTPKADLNRSDQETELASGKKVAINLLNKFFKVVKKGLVLNAPKLVLLGLLYANLCIFL
jgi:hypothetical protein